MRKIKITAQIKKNIEIKTIKTINKKQKHKKKVKLKRIYQQKFC